ncbi:MAG: hypothetical protein AABX23_04525 [Nanoarchaeota archaeon]
MMPKTFEKQQLTINWILVGIAIIGLYFTHLQININDQNTKLYEQTVRPNIKISSYNLDSNLEVYYRNRISAINLDNSSGTVLNFFITNIGKIDAKWVSIMINNSWASNIRLNFDNISSGETEFGQIIMTTRECQDWNIFGKSEGKSLDSCKASENNISLGKENIELKIECINCDPPTQYQDLEVCFESINNNIC